MSTYFYVARGLDGLVVEAGEVRETDRVLFEYTPETVETVLGHTRPPRRFRDSAGRWVTSTWGDTPMHLNKKRGIVTPIEHTITRAEYYASR